MPSRQQEEFDRIIAENVEAIARIEQAERDTRTTADLVADAVANVVGRMMFLWANILFFAGWMGWNMLGPVHERFDPPPFGNLTLIVSLEAIILSIFIM